MWQFPSLRSVRAATHDESVFPRNGPSFSPQVTILLVPSGVFHVEHPQTVPGGFQMFHVKHFRK